MPAGLRSCPITRFFWHSEYFTHQRPDYFASVRMHSNRGNNMEEPHNEEGLKNHHYADGANFISRNGQEYFNIFPVWDWQKIPGTTVVQKPTLPHWKQIAKKGRTGFVGGVADGDLGAEAFAFASVHDPPGARKAWFFFDKEYVSQGAGISAEADYGSDRGRGAEPPGRRLQGPMAMPIPSRSRICISPIGRGIKYGHCLISWTRIL